MILEIKDLCVEYKNKDSSILAVDHACVTVEKGSSVGIVGESGSGKTTLANAVLRLLPKNSAKVTGEVCFQGQNILELSDKEFNQLRWKDISVVFQKSMNALSPIHRIGEQIEDIYQVHEPNAARAEIRSRAIELFHLTNLNERIYDLYPHELSGGMLQRVAIAISLLHHPALIVLDEATTALDVVTQSQILSEIKKLEKQIEMTRIMITHDMSVVATVCDRVVVMYAGRVMEMGSVREVIPQPRHPYTKGLIQSYPMLRAPKEDLKVIPGVMPSLSQRVEGCIFAPRCSKATEKCRCQRPQDTEVLPGHMVACHYPEEY